MKRTGIEIVTDGDKRLYRNAQGYIHCTHDAQWVEVIVSWGNRSYVCHKCGEVVKKELTPTSL